MKTIIDKLTNHFEQNLPFVVYRKPNQDIITGFFQEDDSLNYVTDFQENGFIFCSFDGNKNIIIPENNSEIIVSEIIDIPVNLMQNTTVFVDKKAKSDFENLVVKGINSIHENKFEKVVLSRKEILETVNFDLVSVINKLFGNYKSALRYCFFHPKIGLWFGATPEQLLQVSDNHFDTVSLAGTQKFVDTTDVIWKEKEKEEQQIVTDFISENLRKLSNSVQVSEPFTTRAGNLLHIKSTISGNLNADFNLKNIIGILHPTPAVCGLPRSETKKFIIENENYDREFYSGFLGELNTDNKTDLFVNLRCMKVKENEAHIYAGCGITKDSNPEKEWDETVNKSMTMKNCLDF